MSGQFILLMFFSQIFLPSCTSFKKMAMRLSSNPYENDAKSPDRGKIVFLNNCAVCHEEDARGPKNFIASSSVRPANLILYSKNRASQTIALHVFYGKGYMPAFIDILKEKEIWDVSNYLKKISQ